MSEQDYDKEQLRIMRNAFKAFDHDERGYIEHSDVQSILEILGQKLDEKAIKALLKEVDPKTTGKLDFAQFCRLASRFIEVEEDANALASELKEAFRVYDKEGKGYLTVQILRDILRELDDKLTKNDLDMIIEEIDADGSGTVDFDEFMQVMTGNDFLVVNWQRRLVFSSIEPDSFHRPAPPRLGRRPTTYLYSRIECHFERWLQQVWQPFDTLRCHNKRSISSSVLEPAEATPSSLRQRLPYRPRFPKFVPIFTLYREVLQNPFKRRGRYMITQY